MFEVQDGAIQNYPQHPSTPFNPDLDSNDSSDSEPNNSNKSTTPKPHPLFLPSIQYHRGCGHS